MRAVALLIMLVGWSVLCGALPANATSRPWREMHANSFPDTPEAARRQCEKEFGRKTVPSLTLTKCQQLERMLESGQCLPVASRDGDRFHAIGGVEGTSLVQQLGFAPRALECNLGDGVVARWFTGEDRSCHNVGFVAPPPVVQRSVGRTFALPSTIVQIAPIEPCTCGITLPGATILVPGATYQVFENFGTFGVAPRR